MCGNGAAAEIGRAETGRRSVLFVVAVTDTDATVAKATEMGGNVIAPPFDTPYGRMAVVADDQGAVFAVMTSAFAAES